MFSLDHLHCARWLTVFIKDLEQLNPEVLNAFKKGYFTVKPGKIIFSNIRINQAHEQNNKLVKIHGGAIGIMVNPNALLRWAVKRPVDAELCRNEKLSQMPSKIIMKILKHLSLIFRTILRVCTRPFTIWAILLKKKRRI